MTQSVQKIDIEHENYYFFERGFPIGVTDQQAYSDADLNRAI
jgi:hypothetical protein